MADAVPIHVPRENVNDDSVRLLNWRVKNGEPVRQGQVVAELETSKATFELHSPADGVLSYSLAEGQEVAVGGVLCHVLGEGATLPATSAPAPAAPEPALARAATPVNGEPIAPAAPRNGHSRPAASGTRISPLARRMIEQRGLNPAEFSGKGLVRVCDVLCALGEAPAPARQQQRPAPAPRGEGVPAVPPPVPAAGVAFKTEPLPRAKRVEAKYLSSGRHHTLASVVTVACPTRGLRAAVSAQAGAGANATSILLFETARLLRKYPAFNAFHSDGNANFYEQVNIGFALDGGRGLKVPVIRDADQKSIQQITSEMQDDVVAYLDEKLPVESLAGGTFTVTDLSGEGVFTFHPLINQGQSAILGVGAEFIPPGTSVGMFNLILAFDHQLSEGRAAAKFLGELRDRIGSYEKAVATPDERAAEPACSECLTPLGELRRNEHYLLQTISPGGAVKPVCSVCIAGFR